MTFKIFSNLNASIVSYDKCKTSTGKVQLNWQNEKTGKIAGILYAAFPAAPTVEYYISFNVFIIHCTHVMVRFTAH